MWTSVFHFEKKQIQNRTFPLKAFYMTANLFFVFSNLFKQIAKRGLASLSDVSKGDPTRVCLSRRLSLFASKVDHLTLMFGLVRPFES